MIINNCALQNCRCLFNCVALIPIYKSQESFLIMVIMLTKFGSGIHHCKNALTLWYKYSFNISNKSMKQYGNVPFLYEELTFLWISHGFVIAATSQVVIKILRNMSRDSLSSQFFIPESTIAKNLSLTLFKRLFI